MKIKIGNFNFISDDPDELYLNSYEFDNKLDKFYMDGKEDTLYVRDRSSFDRAYELNLKFEQELLKKCYVIEYTSLIRNKIDQFIKQKALRLYNDKIYSRYELYNEIDTANIVYYEDRVKCNFSYSTKITQTNKLVYETNSGKQIIFNPYTGNIDNIDELYENGFFDKYINSYLILLEIENKTAPDFIYQILNINDFLQNKQKINVMFKDGEKIKVDTKLDKILETWRNKVRLNILSRNKDYGVNDLKSLTFNKNELVINTDSLIELPKQIARSAKDFLLFKIDNMKDELKDDFIECQRKVYGQMPSDIKQCISIISDLNSQNLKNNKNEKIEYPKWFSEDFIDLWKKYDMIKELENANCIEDIKDVAVETGDNELQRIYYMFEGEELEDEESEEI